MEERLTRAKTPGDRLAPIGPAIGPILKSAKLLSSRMARVLERSRPERGCPRQ
jgi:hypothetical protein